MEMSRLLVYGLPSLISLPFTGHCFANVVISHASNRVNGVNSLAYKSLGIIPALLLANVRIRRYFQRTEM